ncbi:Exonuclease V [Trinorchestia longiramus]|nr:Exonuclease V [Trinorchestia longiramus]
MMLEIVDGYSRDFKVFKHLSPIFIDPTMEPFGSCSSFLTNTTKDKSPSSNLDTGLHTGKKMCLANDKNHLDLKTKPTNQNCSSAFFPSITTAKNYASITCAKAIDDKVSISSPKCENSSDILLQPSSSSDQPVLQLSENEFTDLSSINLNNSNIAIQNLNCRSNPLHDGGSKRKNDIPSSQYRGYTTAASSDANYDAKCKRIIVQEAEKESGIKDYVQYCDYKYSSDNLDPEHPPLVTLQSGKVSVSDLTGQLWCEQQLVYSRCVPAGVKQHLIPQRKEVTAGLVLHRARELEVQSYVSVETISAEDIATLPYSNTLAFLRRLLSQESTVVREVHVFGQIDGVPIFGIIDELRLSDGDDFSVELVEFKTRISKTPPKKPQRISHELQSMLYKYMYDDMVRGRHIDHYFTTRGLDLSAPLGPELSRSIQETVTRGGATPFSNGETWTLRRVLEELRLVMAMLPFISRCRLHYCAQHDNEVFLKRQVAYNEPWMLDKVRHSLQFWLGHRPPEGVDVEEAYKCFSCDFQDHCAWVTSKTRELQTRNSVNFI